MIHLIILKLINNYKVLKINKEHIKKNQKLILFLKGIAMGVANIIPGVSGGTIALVTNIYERLINALKKFDLTAIKLLLSMEFKKFANHTDLIFLTWLFSGSLFGVFSVAKLFEYMFKFYPIMIWSFFFGLILASVYFIGKKINNWNIYNFIIFIIGAIVATSLLFLEPANENDNLLFIILCGIIGISGMMLPGLSGSFILILMGNYELILVSAISEFNYVILSFFVIGSVLGLVIFSHIIAHLLKKYKDQTLSILTGFISGSLLIVWPWKKIKSSDISIDNKDNLLAYSWSLPENLNLESLFSICLIFFGFLIVYLLENIDKGK